MRFEKSEEILEQPPEVPQKDIEIVNGICGSSSAVCIGRCFKHCGRILA